MSLINQMLRDLEQRKDTLKIPVTTALPSAQPNARWKLKPMLFIVFSLLGLVALVLQREVLLEILDKQFLSDTNSEISPAQPTLARIESPVVPPTKIASATAVPPTPEPTVNLPPPALPTATPAPTPTASNAQALPSAPNSSTSVAENLPASDSTPIKPKQHHQLKLRPQAKATLHAKTPAPEITPAADTEATPSFTAEKSAASLHSEWLKAKTLLSQKQSQAALRILETSAPKTNDETYLALLGAAQQQIGNSYQASTTYQQLLRHRPEKAEYWLGFAIAQEHNGNTSSARAAYDQALSKNSLATPVIEYIKQRQSALTPE